MKKTYLSAVAILVCAALVGGIAGIGADVVHRHRQHHRPQHQRQHAPQPVAVFVVFVVFIVICHGILLARVEAF